MDALKGNDCYIVINKHAEDFPQECDYSTTTHENLSFNLTYDYKSFGHQIQFFVNDQLIHEANSIADLEKSKKIRIMNKDYMIKSEYKEEINTLHLSFNEIKKNKKPQGNKKSQSKKRPQSKKKPQGN